LFISGLTLIIGPQKTFYFFARKQKLRGTICFLGGILLVFFKWPFIGVVVETFGFLNLFGYVTSAVQLSIKSKALSLTFLSYSDFFPVIITFLRQLPFIGTALSLPYIREVRRFLDSRFHQCHLIWFIYDLGGRPNRGITNLSSMTI
jgi:hypothetical protein